MPLFGAFGGAAGHGLEPGNFPLFCTPCFSCKRMVGPAYGPFGSRNCARRSDIPPFLQIFSWLQAVFDLRLPILQRSFTKFYSMMHSPDLVGMSRLTYMGQPVFAGRTRNETRPDFISCFALHIEECEQTGRNGSTANYRMAYRMLLRYAGGGKLPPEQFTAEWLERYERWLLARGLGTNSVVFHMRSLRAVYNRAVELGLSPLRAAIPFAAGSSDRWRPANALCRARHSGGSAMPISRPCIPNTRWRAIFSCSVFTPGACRSSI